MVSGESMTVRVLAERIADEIADQLAEFTPEQQERALADSWEAITTRLRERFGIAESDADAVATRMVARLMQRVEQARLMQGPSGGSA